ncbi:MAG: elongation factor P [Nitrospira sp.]|nr:elongation factor P [Candidatus Manganitrophaceae bacterium]HIL34274.1 elongation factor P [Candidatus Manganitrophaceae bacterium]
MLGTSDFRGGLKLELDGDPYMIVECQHVKPGKGGAFVRTKLKNLKTGNLLEKTFRPGEKFNAPDLVEREMQFLYQQGDEYHFMDSETYEQLFLVPAQLGSSKDFLKENMIAKILFYRGKPMSVELPVFVELRIVETEPGVRGDTATGGTKLAKLESGGTVKVPLFMEEGTLVKVDTRTGSYIERVK